MVTSNITKQNILDALKYIDKNGIPPLCKSKEYDLVFNRKKYPPKYVVAVADYLAGGSEKPIVNSFHTDQAINCLDKLGFNITSKDSESTKQNASKAKSAKNKEFEKNIEIEKYASKLEESYNIIFRGPPGTGKTYLAQSIAAYLVTDKATSEYSKLIGEPLGQIEMVQFHPNYDYSDFVEGLRPVMENGVLGFDLKPGIFKSFVDKARAEKNKKFVFIIDEINRGEISKIFGELFFSIDPEYRGKKGQVTTQFANLHNSEERDEGRFYVPENVYIIGTMNDIDRSVDSFDFAMRRRFRFIELKAQDCLGMLNQLNKKELGEAKKRMFSLNEAIKNKLNENYQVGGAYFAKLKKKNKNNIGFEELWSDYLEPLLREYIRGLNDEEEIIKELKKAYDGEEK